MSYQCSLFWLFFFFFNDTATTEIYTLSLHDALPISSRTHEAGDERDDGNDERHAQDRKSTRLNSSHGSISYAVFCLKRNSKRMNSSHGRIFDAVLCLDTCHTHAT